MRITDIAAGRAALESLSEKKRDVRFNPSRADQPVVKKGEDSGTDKKVSQDQLRVRDLQRGFMKDSVSMQGLSELQKRLNLYETGEAKNFEELSRDLSGIVQSTRFEGESVISYLSTQIKDDKTLYMFRNSLDAEIGLVQNRLSEERKAVASYLVRAENMDNIRSFSAENALKQVVADHGMLAQADLHRKPGNVASLLGIER